MSTSISSDTAVMIFIRGLPGSGKSFLANALVDKIDKNIIILDPDQTDYESDEYKAHTKKLIEEGVDSSLFEYRFLRAKAYEAITDNGTIVWSQPFTNLEIFKKMIGRMQDHALEQNTKLIILIVEVNADPKIAKMRVKERKAAGGHGPSDEKFARFVNDFFTYGHLGYSIVTVDGTNDVSNSVSTIKSALDLLSRIR